MSAVALLVGLERFRRRAGLTAGVPAGIAAAGLTVAVAEIVHALGLAAGPVRPLVVIPAALAAGVAACTLGWLRRPPLRDIARTIDSRLGLQAVVVTALQCRDEPDVFAARTVARAAEALTSAKPGSVYPWRISRTTGALTAAPLAIALVLLTSPDRAPAGNGLDGGSGSLAGGMPRRGAPAGASRTSRPASALSEPVATAGAESRAGSRSAPRTNRPGEGPTGRGDSTPPEPQSRNAATPPAPARTPSSGPGRGAAQPAGAPDDGAGALTSDGNSGQPGLGAAAPGGGRAGGSSLAAAGTTGDTRGSRATAPPPAGGAEELAQALVRVPMNRRTFVQRYLQSLRRERE